MTTNGTLPDPLSPEDCDLRGYDFMPILGHRLFTSELYLRATGDEFRCALRLWWAAWNQKPAGSLPSDDASLAMLADFGRDMKSWAKVKSWALHGFVSCSDGRLYHPILSGEAVKAYAMRIRHDAKRELDRERLQRWRDAKKTSVGNGGNGGSGNGHETRFETPTETPVETPNVAVDRDRDRDRDKERKGERVERERAPGRAGARPPTLIPDGWKPSDDLVAFAAGIGLSRQATDLAAERMRDWSRGSGKRMADWDATFRNWLRKDVANPPRVQRDVDPIGQLRRDWNLPSFLAPVLDDDEPALRMLQ